jgi:hypothetical protein
VSVKEWMADIGAAAEELGYGITGLRPGDIELVAQQDDVTIRIESVFLSGDLLRARLVKIPLRSGSSYSDDFTRSALR